MKNFKTKVKQFLINRLCSGYETIKSENKELRHNNKRLQDDIYDIVMETDKPIGTTTALVWRITFSENTQILSGKGAGFIKGIIPTTKDMANIINNQLNKCGYSGINTERE